MFLPALEIDLDQAKSLALKNNHLLKKSEKDLKASQWNLIKAYSNLGPSVELTGSKSYFDDTIVMPAPANAYDEQSSHGFSISQPLLVGGSLFLNSRIQSNSKKIAVVGYSTQRLQTIADVESKYFTVLQNENLLEVARKSLKHARENEAIAKVRYDSGTLTQAEYFRVKSETASREVSMLQAESVWNISKEDLANFLVVKEDLIVKEIILAQVESEASGYDSFSISNINEFVKNAVSYAMNNNNSLKSSKLGLKTAKLSKYMSAGQFLPTITLGYSKSWEKKGDNDENDSGTLRLSASLPIFPIIDNFSSYRSSANSYSSAFYNHENTKDQISLAVKNSAYGMITAAKSIKSAKLALDYAEQTYMQMQERFRQNLISATDLLDTEIMYISTQNQYTKSLYDFLKAKSALLNQLGVENEIPNFK